MKEEQEEPVNNGQDAITFLLAIAAVGWMIYVFLS